MAILDGRDTDEETTKIGVAPADVSETLTSQSATNPNDDDEVIDDSGDAPEEDAELKDDADADDDAEEAADNPPPNNAKLQRKLWEGAEAKKKLAEAERKNAVLQQQADAFQVLMKHPKPEAILRGLRENGALGSVDAGEQGTTDLVPNEDFGFDEPTNKGLKKMLNSALGNLLGRLKQDLAPVAQEVVNSREARQSSEWGAAAKRTPGLAEFKDATFALMKSKGLPMEDALLLASKGRSAILKAKAKGATVASKTPTLNGRGISGSAVNKQPNYRGKSLGEILKTEMAKADEA